MSLNKIKQFKDLAGLQRLIKTFRKVNMNAKSTKHRKQIKANMKITIMIWILRSIQGIYQYLEIETTDQHSFDC